MLRCPSEIVKQLSPVRCCPAHSRSELCRCCCACCGSVPDRGFVLPVPVAVCGGLSLRVCSCAHDLHLFRLGSLSSCSPPSGLLAFIVPGRLCPIVYPLPLSVPYTLDMQAYGRQMWLYLHSPESITTLSHGIQYRRQAARCLTVPDVGRGSDRRQQLQRLMLCLLCPR